jgi:glycosyltransferase involved in cell wall biosynthesis
MTSIQYVSVIIPVYNSSSTLLEIINRLQKTFNNGPSLEVILVNDGSDNKETSKICLELVERYPWVIYLDLSINFGEHSAVMAGLNYCTGDCAVIMDDDCQNSPEDLILLVAELERGYDVVYTNYLIKNHSFLRNLGSTFNDNVATLLLNKPKNLYLSSFKIINRFLISEIIKYKGAYPYIDGLILRVTRRYSVINVTHNIRKIGKSNYNLVKLFSLWMNMSLNFSILPLRIIGYLGFLFAFMSIISTIWVFILKLNNPDLTLGWASLIITSLLLGSVQLIGIGVVGEYLGRLFMNSNLHPQFTVRTAHNVKKSF